MSAALQAAIRQAEITNNERLRVFPHSPFFQFARRELDLIARRYQLQEGFDRTFYDSLNIGLMCARELEGTDPTYCNIIYEMLEQVRLSSTG